VALNDAIPRIGPDPRDRVERMPAIGLDSPDITGDIAIPVLSTHTLGELFVPFHMQQVYAQRVADHGAADLLVTRAIRTVGHCSFSTAERTRAFDDLVNWVESDLRDRPAGDDVLNRATVADPLFGCQFTEPDRPPPGVLACPEP
jgi:hypothetical protein